MPSFAIETEIAVSDPNPEAQQMAWRPDGTALAVLAPIMRYVKVYAIPAGNQIAAIRDLAGGSGAIGFAADGRMLIPGCRSGAVALSLWDFTGGACTDIAGPDPASGLENSNLLFDFALDRSRRRLVGIHRVRPQTGEAFRVAVYDATAWRLVADHRLSAIVMALSPDGSQLALNGADGQFAIADTASGKILRRIETGGQTGIRHLAWSPDGRLIASGNMATGFGRDPQTGKYGNLRDRHVLRTWNAANGTLAGVADEPLGGGVESLDFSPDGQRLAATTSDGRLLHWHAATLQTSQTIAQGLHPGTAIVRFSPDGKRLALLRTGLARIAIYRLQ